MNPAPQTRAENGNEIPLVACDGTPLLLRHWVADSRRGSLFVVHGYAEHSARYRHVAAALVSLGLDVFAADLRGHGRSGGTRAHILRFTQYLDDLSLLLDRVRRQAPSAPLFLLGHSLGGLIVCNYATRRPPDCRGIIVSSPFLATAMPVPAYKILLAKMLTTIHPSFSLPTGLDSALLSHDRSVQQEYADDPLVSHRATARWFTESLRAMKDTFRHAGRFTHPCLFLQAGDDRIADPKVPRQLFDAIGSKDKSYVEYPGYYHEVLNEIGKDQVLHDMTRWIEKRL